MDLLDGLLGEATRAGAPIAPPYRRYHERDRSDIAQWLAVAPGRPEDALDDDTLAVLLYALFIGIHVQWRVDPDRIDLGSTLAAMVTLIGSGWPADGTTEA